MNLKDAIDNRRSIRSFEKRQVPKEILKKLVIQASKAPSASNRQPWFFYVVCSKGKRNIISGYLRDTLEILREQVLKKPKNLQKIINSFYVNMGDCPNVIFIFREKIENATPDIYPNDIASISCAVENLMLSAVEYGLGTCWIGSFKDSKIEEKIKHLLNVPNNQELISSILIGYPKKGYKPLIRKKKELKEILKFK